MPVRFIDLSTNKKLTNLTGAGVIAFVVMSIIINVIKANMLMWVALHFLALGISMLVFSRPHRVQKSQWLFYTNTIKKTPLGEDADYIDNLEELPNVKKVVSKKTKRLKSRLE